MYCTNLDLISVCSNYFFPIIEKFYALYIDNTKDKKLHDFNKTKPKTFKSIETEFLKEISIKKRSEFSTQMSTKPYNKDTFENMVIMQTILNQISLPHLVLFTKCTNLCNNLDIHMKNDWFLMIKYVVANLGEIKLCLMPCSS
jgi:hypothetical protein